MRVPPLLFVASAFLASVTILPAEEKPPEVKYAGQVSLVRYDLPRGMSDGYAPTRQLAQRKSEEGVAVDWPDISLNGQELFRGAPEETVSLRLRKGGEAMSPFQVKEDNVIQPGNHWFRAIEWRWGRKHLYTADKTARAANANESATGKYELWTFPIRIKTDGPPAIKNVVLKYAGTVVYRKPGPWRSLTLQLPASEPGVQYELSVDGRPAVRFDIGLMPVKLGTPREQVYQFSAVIPGEPKMFVATMGRPDDFPNPREWQADLAALQKGFTPVEAKAETTATGIGRWLGAEVNRSPLTTYAMALPHGMSGGFIGKGSRSFEGSPAEYATHLAKLNVDLVFDQANSLLPPGDAASVEKRAAALSAAGIRFGLQYDNNWSRPSLQHPNLAFFAHNLPEWHAPLYRSLSLATQRFSKLPNFAGISIGADNAGFASYWAWAPPIPDRPWGEAMIDFLGTPEPKVPRGPSLGAPEAQWEAPVKTTAAFIRYAARYEATFQQYGYFAEAVKDVDPQLVFTSGSFGSSPGTGGRGGWPWASVPGRVMFEGLPVQQAYDWNETRAAKPMHLVALIDRLRSYQPRKRTWALLDNFQLLYGRESYQRAVALALTRGIDGLGTNFIPTASGKSARPDAIDYVAEMNEWARRFGGVFAHTEPEPTIGIFFGQHQAIQRPVVTSENPSPEKLYNGSHEGKVTEALFMCHAAGWPARVITYQELMREPLPASMKTILLVGLDEPDSSWTWAPGLESTLNAFIARGGRIIADETSVAPVPVEQSNLRIAAYVAQGQVDPTPLLLSRNRENIATLQRLMGDMRKPIATSSDPTVWAIPTTCGDVQYVTVVNQGCATESEAEEYLRPVDPRATKPEPWKMKGNASIYVRPQTASIKWATDRPIYDLRSAKRLTAGEAGTVDLTHDAFQMYAVPPREITGLDILVLKETKPLRNAFYEVLVTTAKPDPMRGLPVKISLSDGKQTVELFAATGWPVRLPLSRSDAGQWTVTATELLTGISANTSVNVPVSDSKGAGAIVAVNDPRAIDRFATRKHVALKIGLTLEQEKDPLIREQAEILLNFYRDRGRIASIGRVMAGGLVESLQPLKSPNRYPQWKTVPSDLILLGNAKNNVLILDQARGYIFPDDALSLADHHSSIVYTRSPFVGEYDVLNVIAENAEGIAAGVKAVIGGTREEVKLAQ